MVRIQKLVGGTALVWGELHLQLDESSKLEVHQRLYAVVLYSVAFHLLAAFIKLHVILSP